MAYVCELGNGQQIYLDNIGEQTSIVCASIQPGQQQQSGSSFTTGTWTEPPQLFRTPKGLFIKLSTARGEIFIQVQGQQLQLNSVMPGMQQAQQLQVAATPTMPGMTPTMQPMQPMQPMTMGNMQMSLNPMQMQMGDMQMQMGKAIPKPTVSEPETVLS
jgi:hypothetical protein